MKILILILTGIVIISCENDVTQNRVITKNAYIIGFDPCTVKHNYDLGYIIVSTDLMDTLVSYNFPDSIVSIPKEYFDNYWNSGYFPVYARYKFKISITYRLAAEDEKIYLLCTTDFNYSEFNNAVQVITISATAN